ncbi:hypothetical protein IWW38_001475 [Coemansia aciculifera]|uniref:Uncharacterized protein n=1 Tax=Coemansia aciculifera TaxID=417176 RepID=A0ACC1M6Z8_9FUNG|nr:hypothetical protein IWW38_001475 [Coemansia aciculifera]
MFFERSDLALLLQPIEVAADIDALLEPPPHHRKAKRIGEVKQTSGSDFSINIPSTSLSPVLLLRHQNKKRTGAADSDDDDESEERNAATTTHVDYAVAAALDAELARNRELHAELTQLKMTAKKLAKLVLTNEHISGINIRKH